MKKNPNKHPEKGFLQELARTPKPASSKEPFAWKQPVATDGKAVDGKTSYRLSHFSSAKEGTSNFVDETNSHIQDRRKK